MLRTTLLAAVLSLPALASASPNRPDPQPTILELALEANAATGEFSTLIAAVLATGLEGELASPRRSTVFAPTDAAFAELGLDATNVGTLPVEDLTAILLYHVSPGERFARTVTKQRRIRMRSGGFTFPSVVGSAVFVNDAQVLMADLDASNGVVHVIDGVLMP